MSDLTGRAPQKTQAVFWWLFWILAAIVFEGALRKWVIPNSLHALAFGLKDALALGFIVAFPLPTKMKSLRKTRTVFLVVAILLFPALVVGASKNVAAALITYKNSFLWLVFSVHLAARLTQDIIGRFTRVLAYVACGLALLGVIQYASPRSAGINRYAWSALDSSTVVFGYAPMTGGTRASGTFSFISGMTAFSVFAFAVFLWRLASGGDGRSYWWNVGGALGAITCGLAAGGRASSVAWGFSVLLVLLAAKNVKRLFRLLSLLAMAGAFLVYAMNPAILASYRERWMMDDAKDYGVGRATGKGMRGDYLTLLSEDQWGAGLGQQSGLAAFQATQKGTFEGNWDDAGTRAIVEAGLLGLMAQLMFQLLAISLAARAVFTRSYDYKLCCAALGVFVFLGIFSCGWHDHNSSAMIGIALAFCLNVAPEVVSGQSGTCFSWNLRRTGRANYVAS